VGITLGCGTITKVAHDTQLLLQQLECIRGTRSYHGNSSSSSKFIIINSNNKADDASNMK